MSLPVTKLHKFDSAWRAKQALIQCIRWFKQCGLSYESLCRTVVEAWGDEK